MVEVESVEVDGQPLGGLEVLEERSRGGDLLRAGRARRPRRGAGGRHPGRRARRRARGRATCSPSPCRGAASRSRSSGSWGRCPRRASPTCGVSSTFPRCSPSATSRGRAAALDRLSSRRSGGSTRSPRRPSRTRSARGCRPAAPWWSAPTSSPSGPPTRSTPGCGPPCPSSPGPRSSSPRSASRRRPRRSAAPAAARTPCCSPSGCRRAGSAGCSRSSASASSC